MLPVETFRTALLAVDHVIKSSDWPGGWQTVLMCLANLHYSGADMLPTVHCATVPPVTASKHRYTTRRRKGRRMKRWKRNGATAERVSLREEWRDGDRQNKRERERRMRDRVRESVKQRKGWRDAWRV